MKTYYIIALSALAFSLAGCITLPSPSVTPSPTTKAAVNSALPPPPAKASPAKIAIQKTVNWQAGLFILGGIGCLVFAGFLFYAGQTVPALKIGAAGLLLPIFGVWFAYHWLLVVIVALLVAGVFFLATHFAVVKPILEKLESFTQSVEKKVAAKL